MATVDNDTTKRERRAALLANVDPLLIEASREVDRTLLTWMLSMTPRQRLDAATRAARGLRRFKRVPSRAG